MGTSSGFFKSILGWLPAWVGFGFAILAGVAAIVVGAITPSVGLIAFGVAAVAASILAWFAGGKATPELNPFERSFGASIDGLESWTTVIIILLFVIAIVIAIVAR
jgi:hypothetical protein